MNKKMVRLLVAALVLGPVSANATVVTWEMRGTITNVNGVVPVFPSVQVGDPYVVTWSFDTNAALVAERAFPPGIRYDYDNSSLVMAARVGSSDPKVFVRASDASSTFNRILLRDDSSDQPIDELPTDGISFSLRYDDLGSSISVIFRTTDLTVVNGPGLPENPFPDMPSFPLGTFQMIAFDSEWSFAGADVISVARVFSTVPEPGTLALLGLGLVGLGLSPRRKAA